MKYEIAANRTLCKVHDFIFVQIRFSCLEFELFAPVIYHVGLFWGFFACGQWCQIVTYCHDFFISLGVSPMSTANVSAVQKKQRIQVNLGHHVRLNCQNPTFDKWRPHTKWKKNVKWFKNGRRLRPKTLPKNISIKNKRYKKTRKKGHFKSSVKEFVLQNLKSLVSHFYRIFWMTGKILTHYSKKYLVFSVI